MRTVRKEFTHLHNEFRRGIAQDIDSPLVFGITECRTELFRMPSLWRVATGVRHPKLGSFLYPAIKKKWVTLLVS
ncbi:hypothetical protein RRG08_066801 [Elysia crispata]|uniref:Uncharacterized protein n=1 Tax=Elysia crispata TaxID=231223 RepID=A0AAE1CTZ2_9GAST|nr:hypothetical protein RRG08_066801 [Elysia crispata]